MYIITNAQTHRYIYIYTSIYIYIHESPRWDGADSGFQPPGQPVGPPASRLLVGSSKLSVCYGDDLPINIPSGNLT